MRVTINTPIVDLVKIDHISTRTLNVCLVSGIETLGDIYEYTEEEISSLRNCGKKTMEELKRLAVKYNHVTEGKSVYSHQLELPLLEDAEKTQVVLAETLTEVLKDTLRPSIHNMIGSTQQAARRVVNAQIDYVKTLRHLTLEEWADNLREWLELMERWASHPTLRPEERKAISSHAARVRAFWDESVLLRAYLELPEKHRELWQGVYERHFSTMSVRARNVFSSFVQFRQLLPCFNGMVVVKAHSLKNCGRKSFEEFESFLERVKSAFLEYVARMSHDDGSHYEHQMRVEQLSHRYLFLSPDDVSALASWQIAGGDIPMFYLLERYIEHGKINATVVYRELYGLGGREPKPLVKIAQELNVTRERVRQLASTSLVLPEVLSPIRDVVSSLLHRNVVPDYDPVWSKYKKGLTRFNVFQLMGMCTAVDDSYCIERPSGGKHVYLVKRKLLENVRVMYTINELVRKVELRSIEPYELHVPDFILGGRPRTTFDKDVMELMPIFVDYFKQNPRVQFDGKETLVVQPNLIDMPRELENILERNGSMMSAHELQKAFNDAFPEHAIASMGSFRAQIYRSSIVPVGRSGNYVLPTWTDTYTGKLVDYLELILEASDRPLSIDELTERARQSYPQTTSKSIATLVGLDTQGRFEQFEGYLYGLKRREYDAETYKTRHIVKRFPFDTRLEMLKKFVAAHNHLPMVRPDEEEASLNRWLKNVEGGHVNITPQQRANFDAFMATITTVPHTKPELAFSKSCDQLRHAIEAGEDLTEPPYAALWAWACRMAPLRGTWGDNRNLYFEQLLAFMRSRRLSLDASAKRVGKKRKD